MPFASLPSKLLQYFDAVFDFTKQLSTYKYVLYGILLSSYILCAIFTSIYVKL